MAALKLSKLTDRKTTKIAFTASAELDKLLTDYASAYETEYEQQASITDLIPHMLEAFIKTDRGFHKKIKATIPMPKQAFNWTVQMTRISQKRTFVPTLDGRKGGILLKNSVFSLGDITG
ncbi:MAG: DUF2274 domain-containing protein [Devosiaceae bacterium]|nr:DUF2274 domain-containing protein [Devosiaceae bacterium]